jgi:membrane associated rhomboid family serine protease
VARRLTDPPAPRASRASRAGLAAAVVGAFVALLYLLEVVDQVAFGGRLDLEGVRPRSEEGLVGVLAAPLLHGGWAHLVGNTVPLLVLGFLVLLSGLVRWATVTAVVWLVGGLGTWLVAPPGTVHLGASTLVFGWLSYLLVRGFVSRRPGQIAVGVLVLVLYGGALWGVLPGQPGVSWQAHLFGACGGALAAYGFERRDR